MEMQQTVAGIAERADMLFYASVFVGVTILMMAALHFAAGVMDLRRRAKSAAGPRNQGNAQNATVGRQPAKTSTSLLVKLLPANEVTRSQLRKFLALAGFTSGSALLVYQLVRFISALALGLITAIDYDVVFPNASIITIVAMCALMAALGFYFPKTIVSLRRDALRQQHRQGFPDFLDLMVICTDAGVSVDSAIDRIGGDLALGYPSLADNLRLMCLEFRAGYSLRDALNNLAERLGIDEAKSFATLLQQSEELGSGLVGSLRVYSDEMRAKRLSRAEEKAHALPAKLVIPLGLCVFPVILGITLLPALLRMYKALGQ
jgi:tight adherence protein C